MGGRGKTPVAMFLARVLLQAGERPAVLSRGYHRRRREDGVVVVSDGAHILADLDRSGDEPLMIARGVPGAAVLVCDERRLAGVLAEEAFGATVHVLDDGFQHRQLARDIDLVIVTADDLRGRRIPFGRLRESPSALERASALIVDGGTDTHELGRADRPVFLLHRSLGDPVPLEPDLDAVWKSRGRVVATAGIAQPERFARALEAAGWTVAQTVGFADHHRYSPGDVARLATIAREANAMGVLTTSKDAVRLLPLRPLPVRIAAVPLNVTIEPAADFTSWILTRLQEARA
jgi:tetraacyldisaccharide 4'-kinase